MPFVIEKLVSAWISPPYASNHPANLSTPFVDMDPTPEYTRFVGVAVIVPFGFRYAPVPFHTKTHPFVTPRASAAVVQFVAIMAASVKSCMTSRISPGLPAFAVTTVDPFVDTTVVPACISAAVLAT